MKPYKVLQYNHFFKPGHDLKGVYFFENLEEAEKFMKDREEAKIKWPGSFEKMEYVLVKNN